MASLIEAVHSGDVGEVAERALAAGTLATGTLGAGDPADEIHRRVVAACRSIGAELDTTEATVLARLRAVGIDAGATPRPRLPQRRTVQLRVTDHAVAEQAATALGADGFERWETWTGATRRSFARHADHLTVALARLGSRTDPIGCVGVVGPKRMPYQHALQILSHARDQIAQSAW